MNCTEARARLERTLPRDPRDPALVAHLAQCAECRALADALAVVDARLTAMHARIDVPADFDVRLRARLAQEQQRGRVAVDREALDGELDDWLARLRRESWLDGASILGTGAAVGAAAWHFLPRLAQFYSTGAMGTTALLVGGATAAVTLAVGWVALGDARRSLLGR